MLDLVELLIFICSGPARRYLELRAARKIFIETWALLWVDEFTKMLDIYFDGLGVGLRRLLGREEVGQRQLRRRLLLLSDKSLILIAF